MKTIHLKLFFFILLLAFMVSACKKQDNLISANKITTKAVSAEAHKKVLEMIANFPKSVHIDGNKGTITIIYRDGRVVKNSFNKNIIPFTVSESKQLNTIQNKKSSKSVSLSSKFVLSPDLFRQVSSTRGLVTQSEGGGSGNGGITAYSNKYLSDIGFILYADGEMEDGEYISIYDFAVVADPSEYSEWDNGNLYLQDATVYDDNRGSTSPLPAYTPNVTWNWSVNVEYFVNGVWDGTAGADYSETKLVY